MFGFHSKLVSMLQRGGSIPQLLHMRIFRPSFLRLDFCVATHRNRRKLPSSYQGVYKVRYPILCGGHFRVFKFSQGAGGGFLVISAVRRGMACLVGDKYGHDSCHINGCKRIAFFCINML